MDMRLENRRVAVIGFGLTGRAVVDFLLKKDANIVVFDERKELEDLGSFEKKGVGFSLGPFDFERIKKAELIIMSPGVSSFRFPEFKRLAQQGKEIISEIELAFRFLKGKLISITGTNGKSTTATLVHHLLCASQRKSFLLGNIGKPFIEDVENIGVDEYAVVEVSCFQLEWIDSFRPDYLILTNISEDHLDRYPSMESYIETRKNIFKNITNEDKIILNFDDPIIRRHFSSLNKGKIYWFSRRSEVKRGVFLRGNEFVFCEDNIEIPFFDSTTFPLPGIHNIENALASSLPLVLEGIEMEKIQKGLRGFKGLRHRMEFVTSYDGVDFINDSKATNVDAVLKAILSLDPKGNIVMIMGGKDKGGDFSSLRPFLEKVKCVVLMGEATPKISTQLTGIVRIERVTDMKDAVRVSFNEARPKGIVLLSPGCASFDMFNSFEHRGDMFIKEVMALKEEGVFSPKSE